MALSGRKLSLACGLGGLLAGFWLANAIAQTSALDPPRVAPHIFSVVLENERVRVLKVTERNGETQPLHQRSDRVVVHLNSCAWVAEGEGGETEMWSFGPGDAYWRDAAVIGGRTPDLVQDCLLLEVEIKDALAR
ncbi:MAG: hypothetical protein AAF417_16635 [Pseudomonadota bacterium]